MRRRPFVYGLLIGCAVSARGASADVVVLEPIKDNSLYEQASGSLSNGAGQFLFAGKTASNLLRRAVMEFDIAGGVPSGATINSASLSLHLSKRPPASSPQTHALHRATTEWGEGTSDAFTPGGSGAPSTTDDATWIHSFFSASLWNTTGGDFAPVASAVAVVDAMGTYNWSSPQMAADVQSWLDSPADNHGWFLLGDETQTQEARRYDSRENATAANRPQLTIDFTPAAAAIPTVSAWGLCVLMLLMLAAATLVLSRRRLHA